MRVRKCRKVKKSRQPLFTSSSRWLGITRHLAGVRSTVLVAVSPRRSTALRRPRTPCQPSAVHAVISGQGWLAQQETDRMTQILGMRMGMGAGIDRRQHHRLLSLGPSGSASRPLRRAIGTPCLAARAERSCLDKYETQMIFRC
jgi:hypothetical protein